MSSPQLEFDFGTMPRYHYVEAGGTFEHKSGDCPTHGENVCFFKAYKSPDPRYYCVCCALELMEKLA